MAKGNPIPLASRLMVERRDAKRCCRCGGQGSEWHHRRKRNIRDIHQHCACNGVLLCKTCHTWAHTGTWDERQGFRVSQFITEPGMIIVESWHGPIKLLCDGTYQPLLLSPGG